MNWYVYIALVANGQYYTGISPDVDNRILTHNEGKGANMAKQYGKFILVYKSKPFPNKPEARKREAQIKGWTHTKKEKLIDGKWD